MASTVREVDNQLAASWRAALKATGILARTPDFNAELLVHLCDRMFEFVFEVPRTAAEQETIVLSFVNMIATHMEHFATPLGRDGVSAESFLLALDSDVQPRDQPAASTTGARILRSA